MPASVRPLFPLPSSAASAKCAVGGCLLLQGQLRTVFLRWRLVAEPVAAAGAGSAPGASNPRPILPVVTLLPHVGELLAQERNHGIGGSVALLRRLLRAAGHDEGREGPVKFGRVDAPSAVGVACSRDLAGFDVPSKRSTC